MIKPTKMLFMVLSAYVLIITVYQLIHGWYRFERDETEGPHDVLIHSDLNVKGGILKFLLYYLVQNTIVAADLIPLPALAFLDLMILMLYKNATRKIDVTKAPSSNIIRNADFSIRGPSVFQAVRSLDAIVIDKPSILESDHQFIADLIVGGLHLRFNDEGVPI